jgi:hypothetical protein
MAAVTPIALLTHQQGYKLLCRLDLIHAYKSLWRLRRDGLAVLPRFLCHIRLPKGELQRNAEKYGSLQASLVLSQFTFS